MTAAAEVKSKLTEQLIPTRDPTKGQVSQSEIHCLEYSSADATATLTIPADAKNPVYVLRIVNLVTEAFSGGTATLDVGDGSTPDKYLANAAITEGTIGNLIGAVVGAKLVANSKIVVTVGAGNNAGKGALFVELFRPVSS